MFTGIIECLGTITDMLADGDNMIISVQSAVSHELQIDQSVSHDGICLTVTAIDHDIHQVVAVRETLERTALRQWQIGDEVNLERAMIAGSRLDGHMVQGHVDGVAICTSREDKDGSWRFGFKYDRESAHLLVPKGSICIDGISLTVNEPSLDEFFVDIIPYTYEHTRASAWSPGVQVNLEYDILGKYMARWLTVREM